MAKTEVILTHNIAGLGAESDQVKVAAGYARNYLYPQSLAIPLTAANKRRLDSLRQKRAEREAHELNTMTDLAKNLGKLTLTMGVKTGEDGKMFGSVTAANIADELKRQFEVTLDKKKIQLPQPIRALGDHEVDLRLHSDVVTILKLRVESSTAPKAPPGETQPQVPGRASSGAKVPASKDSEKGRTARVQPSTDASSRAKPQREKAADKAAPEKAEVAEKRARPQKPPKKH